MNFKQPYGEFESIPRRAPSRHSRWWRHTFLLLLAGNHDGMDPFSFSVFLSRSVVLHLFALFAFSFFQPLLSVSLRLCLLSLSSLSYSFLCVSHPSCSLSATLSNGLSFFLLSTQLISLDLHLCLSYLSAPSILYFPPLFLSSRPFSHQIRNAHRSVQRPWLRRFFT